MAHAVEEVVLGLRRLLELPVGLDQLARSQCDLGLEALLLEDDALESDALQSDAVADQPEDDQRIERVSPGRLPRRRISVQLEAQRCLAPHRVGVRRPHFQHMIAGLDVGESDAVLRAQIDPLIRQADHAVRETIAARRSKVERAEIQRQDVGAVVERHAVQEPVR